MDESPGSEDTPTLDESFVATAPRRELSHRERQLEEERRGAEERARRYRTELESGFQARLRNERQREAGLPREKPAARDRRPRARQVIGVVIAVAVVGVAYGSQYFALGRSAHVGLVAAPVTACAASRYPAGAQYSFEQCWGGDPVSWKRCSTLTVAVDPKNAPAGWSEDVSSALGQLRQATGLGFRAVSRGAGNISIHWVSSLLAPAGWESDKAGLTSLQTRTSTTTAQIASANVEISTRLAGGTGLNGELPVLLHELGHAVGLGHFTGPVTMNPVDQGYDSYQRGDLAGFASLYRPWSCT